MKTGTMPLMNRFSSTPIFDNVSKIPFSKMGVDEIETNGKFNPELHQAIDTEESEEHESGDIIKVASKGFTYKGKVIRYSQVVVKK